MAKIRRKFDHEFRKGVPRLARETWKPIAQVAREPVQATSTNGPTAGL